MGRLIIELLASHGNSVEKRYIFEKGHASIGRSYANDVIVDDPFLSPEHLFISGSGGTLQITDLDSGNGAVINSGPVIKDQTVPAASGDKVRIGKTKLRILLPGHPVEPARKIDKFVIFMQYLGRWPVAIIFTLFVFGLDAWLEYLGKPSSRFWEKSFFESALGYFSLAFLYVGAIGAIIYLKTHKAYFKSHCAVFNTAMLLTIIYSMVSPFVYFWVFSAPLITAARGVAFFVMLLGMFWGSVKVTIDFLKWKDIAKLAVIAFTFTIIFAWQNNDFRLEFSSVPSYPSELAPWLQPLTEPQSAEAFLDESAPALFNQEE